MNILVFHLFFCTLLTATCVKHFSFLSNPRRLISYGTAAIVGIQLGYEAPVVSNAYGPTDVKISIQRFPISFSLNILSSFNENIC